MVPRGLNELVGVRVDLDGPGIVDKLAAAHRDPPMTGRQIPGRIRARRMSPRACTIARLLRSYSKDATVRALLTPDHRFTQFIKCESVQVCAFTNSTNCNKSKFLIRLI